MTKPLLRVGTVHGLLGSRTGLLGYEHNPVTLSLEGDIPP
jgi:hypothetical protein